MASISTCIGKRLLRPLVPEHQAGGSCAAVAIIPLPHNILPGERSVVGIHAMHNIMLDQAPAGLGRITRLAAAATLGQAEKFHLFGHNAPLLVVYVSRAGNSD